MSPTPEARRRREIEAKWLLRAIGLAFAFQFIYQFGVVNPQADATHTALCALRDDQIERANSAKAFLREHPRGVHGISVSVIQASIMQAESTVQALGVLSC